MRILLLAFLLVWAAVLPARALEPEVVHAEGGVTAWLVEDHTVPAFSLRLLVRHAGSAYDPSGKEGAASLAAALLTEGAGERDSAAFHDELDFYAIRLGADVSRDDLSISLGSLSEHAEKAFSLMHDMLASPRFDAADISRVKAERLAALKQSEGNAGYQAGKAFYATAFAGHAYARPEEGTSESVTALGRDDFLTYMKHRLRRDEMVISVAGDISPEQLKKLLDAYIAPLPAGVGKATGLPDVTPTLGKEMEKTLSLPQTVVYFALPGVERKSKNYYTAYIMNYLFGGGDGLSSRLAKEIREKRGLAYYAYSDLADYDKAALLSGAFATRNEAVPEAIATLKDVVGKAGKEGFAKEEFEAGVDFLTGSFPAKLTSNRSVSAYLESMQRYGLGRDYLEKRNGYLRKVTLEEVNTLAKNLFKPKNLLIISAGGAAEEAPEKKE